MPKKKCRCGTEFEPILYPRSTIKTKQCVKCLIKKGKKIEDKRVKEKFHLLKEKVKRKSIAELINEARKPFQEWIRLRDDKVGCISCGATAPEIWHGGHYLKAELYSGLIFDEDNCHKQCVQCNYFKNGNEIEYRVGLLLRYGGEFVKRLEDRADKERVKVYSREELQEIKTKYKQKVKLWQQNKG